MSSTCDQVAERVALGEPLGDVGEHAATCERCKRLVALPVELGATHREVDPGIGFSARMTAGAQHRIVVRRRRRIAAVSATSLAAAAVGVLVLTREPAPEPIASTPPPSHETQRPALEVPADDPWNTDDRDDSADIDEDVRALVQLADTDRSARLSADWGHIGKPLAPYRSLLRGVSHE